MKQIIEKINKSWHSNPPCDQHLMQLNKEYQIQKYLSKKSLVIGTDGGDNCIGFYFGEPTFIFLQPLGDLDLSENRFLSQSFTDMFINWLRIR